MTHQEGYLKSIMGSNIYYQGWQPEGESKAVLLIVHGMTEHSGRYMNLVNHFVPMGYAIYGIDHIGHGKSDGKRGYIVEFEDFTETLDIFVDMIHDWHPKKSITLIGHSLGGTISTSYLIDHQDKCVGAVLSGPLVTFGKNVSPAKMLIGKLFSIIMPKMGMGSVKADDVSRDPKVVKEYISDPLVDTSSKITAKLAAETLRMMEHNLRYAFKIKVPILIMQGGADKLVDPDGASMLYDIISSDDKKIIIYDGLYHEIFNEPEHQKVLSDLETWLELRLSNFQERAA